MRNPNLQEALDQEDFQNLIISHRIQRMTYNISYRDLIPPQETEQGLRSPMLTLAGVNRACGV